MNQAELFASVHAALGLDGEDAADAASAEHLQATRGVRAIEARIAMMVESGLPHDTVGLMLNISQSEVSKTLMRPAVQRYVAFLRASFASDLKPMSERMLTELEQFAKEALDTEVEIMRHSKYNKGNARFAALAATTAQDILDRIGVAVPKKVETAVNHTAGITPELAEVIMATFRESRAIDVEFSRAGGGVGTDPGAAVLKT